MTIEKFCKEICKGDFVEKESMLNALTEYEKKIRSDAIDECIKLQFDMSCVENCMHMMDCAECMAKQMEQLKEQK